MKNIDLWWHILKPGDQVFVPMGRQRKSGMAEVYSNGKKYIHVSLNGTPVKIRKDSGCTEIYPCFQVCKDESDWEDSVAQRREFRETLDALSALAHINAFRIKADHVALAKAMMKTMLGPK